MPRMFERTPGRRNGVVRRLLPIQRNACLRCASVVYASLSFNTLDNTRKRLKGGWNAVRRTPIIPRRASEPKPRKQPTNSKGRFRCVQRWWRASRVRRFVSPDSQGKAFERFLTIAIVVIIVVGFLYKLWRDRKESL